MSLTPRSQQLSDRMCRKAMLFSSRLVTGPRRVMLYEDGNSLQRAHAPPPSACSCPATFCLWASMPGGELLQTSRSVASVIGS